MNISEKITSTLSILMITALVIPTATYAIGGNSNPNLGSKSAIAQANSAPLVATASDKVRPLSALLSAQGQTNGFLPPVPDYVGWTFAPWTTFSLIDYAGLANKWIINNGGKSLGTQVNGLVLERARGDGRADIHAQIFTKNALAFATLNVNWENILQSPLAFGAFAQDVLTGAQPARANVYFDIQFVNLAPNAPLPDFVQLINNPTVDQLPLSFTFSAQSLQRSASGKLLLLDVNQVCSWEPNGEPTCSKEIVDITQVKWAPNK